MVSSPVQTFKVPPITAARIFTVRQLRAFKPRQRGEGSMKYFQKRGLFNTKNTLTFIVINLKKKTLHLGRGYFFNKFLEAQFSDLNCLRGEVKSWLARWKVK